MMKKMKKESGKGEARKKSKKLPTVVLTAMLVSLVMTAFISVAAANVTNFTVTPGTGLAGAVDSYGINVTTDGVTKINITIPAGFIVVAPTTGGVQIARVDFWNNSGYYGYCNITANDTNPTTQVDIYCKFGGDEITTTQPINYTAGATTTLKSGFAIDTSEAKIKLPTEMLNGSINITINCTDFQLKDIKIAIRQFVWNPAIPGDYVFTADGVPETVQLTWIDN